jgi:hypothetical protein
LGKGLLLTHVTDYLRTGGYPEVVLGKAPDGYLKTLFESILLKDVVRRFNVRYSGKLTDLGYYLMSNTAREYSLRSLQKALQFQSVSTVDHYLTYLIQTYLVFSVARFSPKAKERVQSPKKIYPIDTGMLRETRFANTPDLGRLLETLVMGVVYRSGLTPYTYKTSANKEVDLVIHTLGRPQQLIQICYDLQDPKTKKREISALLSASAELGCEDLLIITLEEEALIETESTSIKVVPLWKWLLQN